MPLFMCVLMFLLPVSASGNYELTWSTVTGGGGQSSNGSYTLIGAAGSFSTIFSSPNPYAPVPNPMEWVTVPYAVDSSSITMMASEANDPAGGIEYFFKNATVTDGGHDSGWQSDRTYTDIGLSPDTTYEYRVKARDAQGFETEYSFAMSARTLSAQGSTPLGSAKPIDGALGNDLNLQVNPFTGSVSYSVPIALPPGRQGSGPQLALSYGGGGNGWCGVGWSIGMGAIQRDTRRGVPVARSGGAFLRQYDDTKGFTASFGTVNSRLVEVNTQTHEYRAEVDQAFMKYQYDAAFGNGGLWTVTDKSGNKFYFGEVAGENPGETAGAIMKHSLFNSGQPGDNVFMWSLAMIQDINGNLTYIYYSELAGQIYLDEIRYNGHTVGPLSATSRVKFELEDRSDSSISYSTGYRIENTKRLKDIRVEIWDHAVSPQTGWVPVRRYNLEYQQSPTTLRSLLKSVTIYGADDTTALPPIAFAYTEKPFEFERDAAGQPVVRDWGPLDSQVGEASWNSPVGSDFYQEPAIWTSSYDRTHVTICDINGDTLPDRVLRHHPAPWYPPNNVFRVQLNTGSGFTSLEPWGPIDNQGHGHASSGDVSWNSPRTKWRFIWQGHKVSGAFWVGASADTIAADLMDLNGDGLPDRIMRLDTSNYAPPNNVFRVQLSSGLGFQGATDWGPLESQGYTSAYWYNSGSAYEGKAIFWNSIRSWYEQGWLVDFADMDSDGLPDRVMRKAVGPFDVLKVQFNTGNGFENNSGAPVVVDWGPLDLQGSDSSFWGALRGVEATGGSTLIDLFDINGDGLTDRVMWKRNTPYDALAVQYNTGTGFSPIEYWGPLSTQGSADGHWAYIQAYNYVATDMFVDLRDINGDGLPDRIMRKLNAPFDVFRVQLNTGRGFQSDTAGNAVLQDWEGVDGQGDMYSAWASVTGIHPRPGIDSATYVTLLDIDGDGLNDRVMRERTTDQGGNPSTLDIFKVQLNQGPVPDMLMKVTGKLGGSVEITYDRSNSDDDYDRHKDNTGVNRLPVPVYVAKSVKFNDGMGTDSTTTYDYSRGFWDAARREFGGFGKVEITDPHGKRKVNYYHQGGGYDDPSKGETDDVGQFPKRGMAYRTEVWGNDGLLYNVAINKVEVYEVQPGSGWYFPYTTQTIIMDYEGAIDDSGTFRAKAEEVEHDLSTGNPIRTSSWGEVTRIDVTNHTFTTNVDTQDDFHTHTIYRTFTGNADILNKPAEVVVTDSEIVNNPSAEILQQTLFFYDEDTPGSCLYTGTKGNLTQKSVWLDKTASGVADRYISSYIHYDVYGNSKATIDPAGVTTVVQFDTDYKMFAERVLKGKGSIDASTFDFLDEEGKFITEAVYDLRSGAVVTSTDVMGIVTENLYDEFFRLTDVYGSTTPFGATTMWQTTIEYNLGGITGGTTSENYVRQRHNGYEAYSYNDGLGRVIQIRTRAETGAAAEFRATHTLYDQAGRIEFVSVPYFDNGSTYHVDGTALVSTTEYDPIGRPWRITPSPGDTESPTGPTTTQFKNGADVWATIVTDAEGNITKQYYDAQDRVIELIEVLTDPVNPTTNIQTLFGYDRLGRMTQVQDNEGNTIMQYYDSLDRRIAIDDPDMGHWEYEYDDVGNLVEQTDAGNNRTEMIYNEDEIGRMTGKEVYDSLDQLTYTATYTYDISDDPEYTVYKGLAYKVVDKEGTVYNGYDTRGRLIKATRSLTINNEQYTVQTAYDDAGRISALTYPGVAAQVWYEYDSAGNLIEVSAQHGTGTPGQTLYQATSFNETGQLEGVDYGNGVRTRYLYYPNSRRRERILTDYEGNPTNPNPTDDLQNLRYTYDMVSNITSITDNSPFAGQGEADSTFSNIMYDGLDRLRFLTYAAQAPTATNFEYDAIGNITYNGEVGGSNYTYDPTKVHAVISAHGKTYGYDACGNMTHRNSASQNMFYDEENQLTRYEVDASTSITFGYGVDGVRLWKKKNTTITGIWIGGLWEYKVEDGDGTGDILCHVNVDDGLVCTFEPNPAPDSVFYYYHSDHLGSSSLLTDPNGNIYQHYGYRAFGAERWDDSSYDANINVTNRYTGQLLDKDTGLYYYGSRYYDPELARFVQADPVVPGSITTNSQALNRYTYSFNNPLIFTDPTGNSPTITAGVMLSLVWNGPAGMMVPNSIYNMFTTQTNSSLSTAGAGTGATALQTYEVTSTAYSPPNIIVSPETILAPFNDPELMKEWRRRKYAYEGIERIYGGWVPLFGPLLKMMKCHNQDVPVTDDMIFDAAFGAVSIVSMGTMGMSSGPRASLNYADEILGFADDVSSYADDAANYADDVTARLQSYVSRAARKVDALGDDAFTRAQFRAIQKNPSLRSMYRGNRIDVMARRFVKEDPSLKFLKSSYNRGADFVDPLTGRWWDITTPGKWPIHVQKYGPGGTLLPTK